MRKVLFVLLILMVGAFCISAAPIHPSGGIPLEIVMSDGYGVATPDTVLAGFPQIVGSLGSVIQVQAVIFNNLSPAIPQDTDMVLTLDIGHLQTDALPQRIDFPLLC